MPEQNTSALDMFRSGLHGKGVLVVGDLMLDQNLWGEVDRVSPEAPVPVVNLSHESEALGGAANVANNLVKLGMKTSIAGFVGNDVHGEMLLQRLKEISKRK